MAARRNQIGKHVLVLPIVKAIAEFVQIEGQILLADVVVVPHDPAFSNAQKDSIEFVWTLPRTHSPRAWPTVSCGIPARTNL